VIRGRTSEDDRKSYSRYLGYGRVLAQTQAGSVNYLTSIRSGFPDLEIIALSGFPLLQFFDAFSVTTSWVVAGIDRVRILSL